MTSVNCTACPLHETRNYIVWGEGPESPRILFVGEGPGELEDLTGKPFVGPSGKMLRKAISTAGLMPNDVFITNLVRCRPPSNRNPKPSEIDTCTELHLRKEIRAMQPQLIVAVGAISVKHLTGRALKDTINQVVPSTSEYGGCPVLCWYHPAYVLRRRKLALGSWTQGVEALKSYLRPSVVVTDEGRLSMDTETGYPVHDNLTAISASYGDTDRFWHGDTLPEGLRLAQEAARPIFHNAAFDLRKLERDFERPLDDTMIMAYLLGEPQVGLKPLSLVHLGRTSDTVDQLVLEYGSMADVPPDRLRTYACSDSRNTLDLYGLLSSRMGTDLTRLYDIELKVVPILMRATDIGIPLDFDFIDQTITEREATMRQQVIELGGINPGSPIQLRKLLFQDLGLPVLARTKETREPATDKDSLEHLQRIQPPSASTRPVLAAVIAWKEAEADRRKLRECLALAGPDGKLHPEFQQARVASGRLASTHPNVQNLKKYLRRMAKSPEGYGFLHGDMSQLELRTQAAIAGETRLIEVFRDDGDPHQALADDIDTNRDRAKTLNYALSYGAEAPKIALSWGVAVSEAEKLLGRVKEAYPKIALLKEKVKHDLENNEVVYTLFGRPRRFPGYNTYPFYEKSAAQREAYNHVAGQGTAADIVKMLMVEARQRGLNSLWNQVHDSTEYVEPTNLLEEAAQTLKEAVETTQVLPNGVRLEMKIETSEVWL